MPSPMEATSRRIAWDRLTTCPVASVSGSASRIAISVIERAVKRISCARISSTAVTMIKAIGPSSTARFVARLPLDRVSRVKPLARIDQTTSATQASEARLASRYGVRLGRRRSV